MPAEPVYRYAAYAQSRFDMIRAATGGTIFSDLISRRDVGTNFRLRAAVVCAHWRRFDAALGLRRRSDISTVNLGYKGQFRLVSLVRIIANSFH